MPWILENPKTSRAWLTPPLKRITSNNKVAEAHYCQYGQPWKKATHFVHSKAIADIPLKVCISCNGLCSATKKPHVILRGKDAAGNFRTAAAQPYPKLLCEQIAAHMFPHLAAHP